MSARHCALWLVALGLAQAGCGKLERQTGATAPTSPTAGANASAGAGSSAEAGGAGGNAAVEEPLACPAPHPGPSPLSRLGNDELNRTLRAFVPQSGDQLEELWLPETSWDDDPASEVTNDFVQRSHRLVHDIAQRLTDPASGEHWLAGCDVASRGEIACRDLLLEPFLERAYRRAVTDEDREELNQVFADGKRLGGDFASGMRAVVEVALMSPDFTYLLEQGSGEAMGDVVQLTAYETAARLAYFLTGGPPDAELFGAAKQGDFDSTQLTAQATRLLGSPENRGAVRRFYSQLVRLDSVGENPSVGLTPALAQAASEAAGLFIEDVTFDGAGTFRALLTEPSTWLNQPLATFYGYSGLTGDGFQKLKLDEPERTGLFTQPAYLAAFSHAQYTSPVHRSLPILGKLLCVELPPPPPGITTTLPDLPEQATTRQRLEAFTAAAPCQGCHHDINPIGFAFEHYDAVGKWRDTEQGLPIDSSGVLERTDARGPFADASELMSHIAESHDAKACFVTQWLGRAYRRAETPEDACTQAELARAFEASDGNIVGLLAALVQTDNFRYRLKSELAP